MPLIATIAAGLVLAIIIGLVAHRLRIQPLIGYLLAGVMVGLFTLCFVADAGLAHELAEISVILLMFGVGLHFSLKDLVLVARTEVPGAVGQISTATVMGGVLALALGWDLPAALVFGLALSVASKAVLVRALRERGIVETARGRIAVGWLIVQDLALIVALIMLPTFAAAMAAGSASTSQMLLMLGWTLAKVAAFAAVVLVAARRVIPWVMHYTAHTGSRELFPLAICATAFGVAFGAAKLFGVSFALGAFFAGMVLGRTKLSQRATERAMPLRDAFAVLFFVSVGMLFNPAVLVEEPLAVIATVLIIVSGKSVTAYAIVRAFGHPAGAALTVSVNLAQIGEFSFILVGLGITLGLLLEGGRDLILAGAILSILVNPFVFGLVDRRRARVVPAPSPEAPEAAGTALPDARGTGIPALALAAAPVEPSMPLSPAAEEGAVPTGLTDYDMIVGYGRVGSLIEARPAAAGRPVLVLDERDEAIEVAGRGGAELVVGNAADPGVLALANLAAARRLFVTIPEAFEAGQVVQQARALNPALEILARAHGDDCMRHLDGVGASLTVLGEREIAQIMLARAFPLWNSHRQSGRPPATSEARLQAMASADGHPPGIRAALVHVTTISLVAGLGLSLVPPFSHMLLFYQVPLIDARTRRLELSGPSVWARQRPRGTIRGSNASPFRVRLDRPARQGAWRPVGGDDGSCAALMTFVEAAISHPGRSRPKRARCIQGRGHQSGRSGVLSGERPYRRAVQASTAGRSVTPATARQSTRPGGQL